MKRSTRVALSLLIPAMTAFGCGQKPQPPKPRTQDQTASTCDRPPQPGEAEKTPCPPQQTTHHSSTRSSSYHGYGARPAFFGPSINLGGSSTTTHTTSSVNSPSHPTTSGIAHSTTGTSHAPHSTSSSHVSSGGFGRIGSFFSGGS